MSPFCFARASAWAFLFNILNQKEKLWNTMKHWLGTANPQPFILLSRFLG
jgi:hypothetical protein